MIQWFIVLHIHRLLDIYLPYATSISLNATPLSHVCPQKPLEFPSLNFPPRLPDWQWAPLTMSHRSMISRDLFYFMCNQRALDASCSTTCRWTGPICWSSGPSPASAGWKQTGVRFNKWWADMLNEHSSTHVVAIFAFDFTQCQTHGLRHFKHKRPANTYRRLCRYPKTN